MTLSSRRDCSCGPVGGVVAQHGPQDVEASAGQGEDGLGVGFAFGSLAVVVGPGGGVGADGDLGGQVAGSQQSSVVAAGAFEVAADAPGIAGYWGKSGDAREAVDAVEGGHVTAGGSEELGSELDAESGHAQDDLGVAVAAKSVLDHRFGVADFGVEGHHLLGQPRDHGGGDLLAGDGGVLCVGGLDGRGGDGSSVAGLAFPQPPFQRAVPARRSPSGV